MQQSRQCARVCVCAPTRSDPSAASLPHHQMVPMRQEGTDGRDRTMCVSGKSERIIIPSFRSVFLILIFRVPRLAGIIKHDS